MSTFCPSDVYKGNLLLHARDLFNTVVGLIKSSFMHINRETT